MVPFVTNFAFYYYFLLFTYHRTVVLEFFSTDAVGIFVNYFVVSPIQLDIRNLQFLQYLHLLLVLRIRQQI